MRITELCSLKKSKKEFNILIVNVHCFQVIKHGFNYLHAKNYYEICINFLVNRV